MRINLVPGEKIKLVVVLLLASFNLFSCRSGSNSSPGITNLWTWVSGSNVINMSGSYLTNAPNPGNVPGARFGSVSWSDGSGNLWLFGGYGYVSVASYGALNDFWKFDGTNWTWAGGSNIVNQPGSYGTLGMASLGNIPGARYHEVSWNDSSGNLWLFGGVGYDSAGNSGYLNDLWKFDGSVWTWTNGNDIVNTAGNYGSLNTQAPGNVPGARFGSVSWIDGLGQLWLFGGIGLDANGNSSYLNDLWKFDRVSTNWTWIGGSYTVNQIGNYGSLGVASSTNIPGARYGAASWSDKSGNFWLFGGVGNGTLGQTGDLNDLWKFDGTNWTWMSGSDLVNQSGSYGALEIASSTNIPGGRNGAVTWTDGTGNLWVFGGFGYDSAGNPGNLNDLWKFDGANWTWVSGSSIVNQRGIYGAQNIASSALIPGARAYSVNWIDKRGNLWLFGGNGFDWLEAAGDLNDLWHFHQ